MSNLKYSAFPGCGQLPLVGYPKWQSAQPVRVRAIAAHGLLAILIAAVQLSVQEFADAAGEKQRQSDPAVQQAV